MISYALFHFSNGWVSVEDTAHSQHQKSVILSLESYTFGAFTVMNAMLNVGLFAGVLLIGTFGNLLIIVTITRNTTFHRAPFFFLLNLSISDLCRSLFCIPFVIASIVQDVGWIHGEVSCIAIAFTNFFFVFNSFISLMVIAIDRYISVAYPYWHKRWLQGPTSLTLVAVGWMLSALVSLPPVFSDGSYTFVEEENQCTFKYTSYKHNDTFGFLLVLTAVQFGSIFIYARIFIFLRDHRRMKPVETPAATSSNWTFTGLGLGNVFPNAWTGLPLRPIPTITQNLSSGNGYIGPVSGRRNEHLTRLFFAVTLCVYCLWSFYSVQYFLLIFTDTVIPKSVRRFTTLATFLQVCVSPVTFTFHYRKLFLNNLVHFHLRREFR
ncbi:probable G-protein coupled receptor 85 [Saccostrea echinata]|uniref:probable G-protein coupled receptor 85 n=1 Tax=Saccostrea echinata TaxID=191078 RepID=UPI002A8238EA|nr:probable G-protein coupled receptor 85 [Saccostrea echinata]